MMRFDGNTFVAFLDISGFKELMKQDKAWKALDCFYNSGYRVTNNSNQVEGIFVSDCGILFCRPNTGDSENCTNNERRELLRELLRCVKEINQDMAKKDFMLTTAIAYGLFTYEDRLVTDKNRKNMLYGDAYLKAYLDTESSRNKLHPGQCRIIINSQVKDIFNAESYENDSVLKMVKANDGESKHYYFYWMVNDTNGIDEFDKQYNDSYNLKFKGMLTAIQKAMQ